MKGTAIPFLYKQEIVSATLLERVRRICNCERVENNQRGIKKFVEQNGRPDSDGASANKLKETRIYSDIHILQNELQNRGQRGTQFHRWMKIRCNEIHSLFLTRFYARHRKIQRSKRTLLGVQCCGNSFRNSSARQLREMCILVFNNNFSNSQSVHFPIFFSANLISFLRANVGNFILTLIEF